MTLAALDTPAVARALALVAARPDEAAELYFERRLDAELPPADATTGFRVRREAGLAARLMRDERVWLASRDEITAPALADVLRAVARTVPPALPEPSALLGDAPLEPPPFAELAAFGSRLERALRRHLVGFALRTTVRWHEREVRVVTTRTATGVERERFADVVIETEWGRVGALAPALDDAAAAMLAERLVAVFRSRAAPPPPAGRPPLLLAPAAAAVALHECVAHALEADLLAASGNPAAADGLELGPSELDVLDDPAAAPAAVARAFDDEGQPTCRRWLLRGGHVSQPLADLRAARRWPELIAGSGFRGDRHAPPLARTHHLELLAGTTGEAQLLALADGGLRIAEIARGALEPASGRFTLEVTGARRVRGGALGEPVGAFRVRGRIAGLLGGVLAIGDRREAAGAGWCAKHGQRRAVWATVPALVVAGLEVEP
jgi:predicted Zn-dependent protease